MLDWACNQAFGLQHRKRQHHDRDSLMRQRQIDRHLMQQREDAERSLQRDRGRVRLDLGKRGNLRWSLDYEHENRTGLKAGGAAFGFGLANAALFALLIQPQRETSPAAAAGREVLRQACVAVRIWRDQVPGCGHLAIAVNVSLRQLLSGLLFDQVAEVLRETSLPRKTLILEITESAELADLDHNVTAELDRLRELGVRISVDDFGSGYSSVGFLNDLAADALKIDQSLLDFDTQRRGSMVTAIAELGRTLGLTVVVEGVETAEHLRRAADAQCDAAQGYQISEQLPFDAVAGFLAAWPEQRLRILDRAPTG